jgi:hypothetical protein
LIFEVAIDLKMSSFSIVVLILFHFLGCKLFEHQEPSGSDMPDSSRDGQGEDAGGDPQDV